MKVEYLFSRNKKIGSKLISWVTNHLTKEPNVPSHIAILINERWVHESTLEVGVRVISYSKWLKLNEEIDKIICKKQRSDYSEIKMVYQKIKNKKYDWLGVLYLGFHLVMNKFFGKSIPSKNAWDDKGRYFCCEAVEILANLPPTNMKTPVQLLAEFRKL